MIKRVVMTSILIIGVVAILRVNVDAHLAGYVYDPTIRHVASYDCTGNFQQVPNLFQHPALFRCEAIARSFEVLCQNPNGQVTFGNNIQITVLAEGETPLTPGDLTKKKGKATSTVPLPDTVMAAAHRVCSDRNLLWTAADEFVTEWDAYLRTFDLIFECPTSEPCTLPIEKPAFAALVHCTRPVNPANGMFYTLDPQANNPPPGTPENPVFTNYPCAPVVEVHCDGVEPCLPVQTALRQGGPLEQPYTLLAGLHSLWKQTLKNLSLVGYSEPQPTKLAQGMRNAPTM